MVARSFAVERIRAVLARISSRAADAASFTMREPATTAKSGLGVVLSGSYAVGSVMLWLG